MGVLIQFLAPNVVSLFTADAAVIAAGACRVRILCPSGFPDTLLPMGLATACGSVLSVVVCLIMYTTLKKKGLFGVATR